MENIFFQVLLLVLPVAAVMITTVYFLRRESAKEVRNAQITLKKNRDDFFLPNRVEAYQRIVLLMERIHPNSLVMRHHNPGLPAMAMQQTLLESIRQEYDHNIAQQLYISKSTWDLVKKSKDETIKVINMAGQQMEPTSTAMDLSSKIFELVGEIGTLPTEVAVDALKEELQRLF